MAAWVTLLTLAGTISGDEFSSCLQNIAQMYLRNRCLSFLFPLNFTKPSLVDVSSPVRSPLLKTLHEGWMVNLPAVNQESVVHPFMEPGHFCYLHCAHIIILEETIPYVKQMEQILYTFYGHYYRDGGGNRTRIVITITAEVSEAKVYQLLKYMFKMGEIDVIFVGKKDGVINVFTLFPYGKDKNSCPEDNTGVEALDRWVDDHFEKSTELFPNKVPVKFNNCTILVGTMNDPPHIILNGQGDVVGGVEYRIVETIGLLLGLRIRYKLYSINDTALWTEKERPHGMRTDLRGGKVDAIVSGHSNYIYSFSCITIPYTYLMNRVTWFFSNPKQVPNWELIILAFNRTLWTYVVVATVAFPLILHILSKFIEKKHPFQRLSTSMIVMLGLLFSNPTNVKLKGALFRISFMAWIFYTFHINQAYSAALTSLLVTGKIEPKITSFQQILQRNLKTAMTEDVVLRTSGLEDPIIRNVLSNRIVIKDVSEMYLHHEYGNVSLLETETSFIYKMKLYDLPFYKSELNLGFVCLGLKMRRNHFLIDKMAELSGLILENGFVNKFYNEYWFANKNPKSSGLQSFKLKDLAGPFLILFFGSTISLLVFLWEILIQHLDKKRTKDIQSDSQQRVKEFVMSV